ncbi:MAG: hypothetical protein KatS3mg087_1309 [Patescibacteria group bacterium]|nr:MAG: hypothetical protein KatS3mg087_1309 [Patescibacteria group bacterium]
MALPVQDIFVIPLAVLEDQIYSLEEVPKYHFAGSILNPCPFTKVGWGNAIGHIDPFTFHAVKRDDPNAPSKTSAPKVKDVFIKPYAIAHNKYPFEFNRIKNNEEQARLLLNQIAPLHTRSFPIITDYDELKTKQKDPSVGFLCNLVKVFEGFACIRNIDPKYFEDTKIDPDEKAKNDADKSLLYAEQRFERRGSRVYSRLNDKDFSTDLGHVLVVGYQQDIYYPECCSAPSW